MAEDNIVFERIARLEQRADTSEKHVGVLFDNMKDLHKEIHDGHAVINSKLDALASDRWQAKGAVLASMKWIGGIVVIATLALGYFSLPGM